VDLTREPPLRTPSQPREKSVSVTPGPVTPVRDRLGLLPAIKAPEGLQLKRIGPGEYIKESNLDSPRKVELRDPAPWRSPAPAKAGGKGTPLGKGKGKSRRRRGRRFNSGRGLGPRQEQQLHMMQQR